MENIGSCCSNRFRLDLREGVLKNHQKLEAPVLASSTKDVENVRPITPKEIAGEDVMTQEVLDLCVDIFRN